MGFLVRLLVALGGGVVVIAVLVGLLSFPFWDDPPSPPRDRSAPRTLADSLDGRYADVRGYEVVGRGVIVPVASMPQLLRQCSRATVSPIEGYWRPERAQIEDLERHLPVFLLEQDAAIPGALATYIGQYGGVVSNGRRLIYASFLAADAGADESQWQRNVVLVCDGGRRFWGVSFDVQTKVFADLTFNGDVGGRP
jgi:hypothetical protein